MQLPKELIILSISSNALPLIKANYAEVAGLIPSITEIAADATTNSNNYVMTSKL
jgi:hypothetical protein